MGDPGLAILESLNRLLEGIFSDGTRRMEPVWGRVEWLPEEIGKGGKSFSTAVIRIEARLLGHRNKQKS